MKIIISKYAGFCGGVKAAVLMLKRALRKNPGRTIKVLGELVHNPDVNQDFKDQGVIFVDSKEEAKPGDLIFVRAHGTPEETYKYFESRGIDYIDATCYKVKVTQQKIKELEKDGWQVAIFGEEKHPETIGLVGHTTDGFIVNEELLDQVTPKKRLAIICQSTSNRGEFKRVCDHLNKIVEDINISPSFCDFTVDAQSDARSIRDMSNAMLVVGGKNSSNTVRLFEVCSETVPSYHIQNARQIEDEWLEGVDVLGLTAGASTPSKIIEEIIQKLKTRGATVEKVD